MVIGVTFFTAPLKKQNPPQQASKVEKEAKNQEL